MPPRARRQYTVHSRIKDMDKQGVREWLRSVPEAVGHDKRNLYKCGASYVSFPEHVYPPARPARPNARAILNEVISCGCPACKEDLDNGCVVLLGYGERPTLVIRPEKAAYIHIAYHAIAWDTAERKLKSLPMEAVTSIWAKSAETWNRVAPEQLYERLKNNAGDIGDNDRMRAERDANV